MTDTMGKKTLLLCFIHGFKGDEETFYGFPEDLKRIVAEKREDLNVQTRIYPKYETRGDLAACATTFREWLQDQVTDLERDAATPQAILNPSVNVILVAHSMGGFVAADTLFTVLDNGPISHDPTTKLMFPLIQGVLAFDTPYNGLSRSMFAYGAFSQYQNVSGYWNIISAVSSSLAGAGSASTLGASSAGASAGVSASSAASAAGGAVIASQASSWRKWQALAARTGTAGAIIAGGVTAYMHRAEIQNALSKVNRENLFKINRENVSQGVSQGLTYVSRDSLGEGFAWMASHLKFVGALMKTAQLKGRLDRLEGLKGIGVVDFYTSLGENGYWSGGYFVPRRTFCAVPVEGSGSESQEKKKIDDGTGEGKIFREMPNTKAKTEIEAHCSMFLPLRNDGYEHMLRSAGDLVIEWTKLDPRKVVDEHSPGKEEVSAMESETKLFDDDGKVRSRSPSVSVPEGPIEDEMQLQEILKWQNLPHDDIDDEGLQRALGVPLPEDEVFKEALDAPAVVSAPVSQIESTSGEGETISKEESTKEGEAISQDEPTIEEKEEARKATQRSIAWGVLSYANPFKVASKAEDIPKEGEASKVDENPKEVEATQPEIVETTDASEESKTPEQKSSYWQTISKVTPNPFKGTSNKEEKTPGSQEAITAEKPATVEIGKTEKSNPASTTWQTLSKVTPNPFKGKSTKPEKTSLGDEADKEDETVKDEVIAPENEETKSTVVPSEDTTKPVQSPGTWQQTISKVTPNPFKGRNKSEKTSAADEAAVAKEGETVKEGEMPKGDNEIMSESKETADTEQQHPKTWTGSISSAIPFVGRG